jgi:cytochrome P450
MLHHDPPIHNTRRVMSADALFEDRPVRAGDTALLVLASAARDLRSHEAPDELRLDRLQRTTLPLGAGAHACPGGSAALAVAECAWRHIAAQVASGALEALVRGVNWRPSANASIPTFA